MSVRNLLLCALLAAAACDEVKPSVILIPCGDGSIPEPELDASSNAGLDAAPPAADGGDAGSESDDAGTDPGADAGIDPALDAAQADAGPFESDSDAGPSACPPLSERSIIDVPGGVLDESLTHWTCDHVYVLNGLVFVSSGDAQAPQVLTIDPGTVVRGQVTAAARGFLVITRTGRIEAAGTRVDPIVFTSANRVGQRARDDWGGITLLGAASTGGTRRAEGFPATVGGQNIDAYLAYGPFPAEPDAGADGGAADAAAGAEDAGIAEPEDAHDCGTLSYVRVEFASFNAGGGMGNESNGIQLYACGYQTEIDHVHVHRSGDDGIEVFGGSVDFRHIVITGASDDSFDWDDGWRGRAQFMVAQQYPDLADLGFEAGGSGDTPTVEPNPRMFNVTLIGTNGALAGKVGGRLRGGSRGTLRNFIFLGFTGGALDIGGTTAVMHLRDGSLSVRNTVFWRGQAGVDFPAGTDDTPDDADPDPGRTDNIDEESELTAGGQLNWVVDPQLSAPFDVAAPRFTPRAGAPLNAGAAPTEAPGDTRPAFLDPSATFIGAFDPDGADWTQGWTAFPAD